MRIQIHGKAKDAVHLAMEEQQLSASRATAYILKQWHLIALKKEEDGLHKKES